MQTAARGAVSEADLAFFERNGYLVVRGLLTPDEVQRMRRRADELVAPEREYSQSNRARRKAEEQAYVESSTGQEATGAGAEGGMGMSMGMTMDMGTENMPPTRNSVTEE
jgi:hypothetical protein